MGFKEHTGLTSSNKRDLINEYLFFKKICYKVGKQSHTLISSSCFVVSGSTTNATLEVENPIYMLFNSPQTQAQARARYA